MKTESRKREREIERGNREIRRQCITHFVIFFTENQTENQ